MSGSLYDVNAYPKCISDEFVQDIINGKKDGTFERGDIACDYLEVTAHTEQGNHFQYTISDDARILQEAENLLNQIEHGSKAHARVEAYFRPVLSRRSLNRYFALISGLDKLENACEADHPGYTAIKGLINGFNRFVHSYTGLSIDIKSCPAMF